MPKDKLPKLTEADVEELTYGRSFERGEEYFLEGIIRDPVCHGFELSASCYGSRNEPYNIRITLHEDGINHTSCSCPYDQGGICKHRVALLLTYIHKKELIHSAPMLSEILAGQTKEDLISIINDMIAAHPDLLATLEFSAETR